MNKHYSDNSGEQAENENAKEKILQNEDNELSNNIENSESTTDNDVAKFQEQIQTLKDTLLRKAAEMENLKKRCEREKIDAVSYANTKFAKDLLSVLDNFDRIIENSKTIEAYISEHPNLKAVFDGILLCNKELLSILQKHGITMIKIEKGSKFNPKYHQAMCEVESENDAPGTIVQIFQNGYIYNERLLRPSMVSVSKKK